MRALNDGAPPWNRQENLTADLWALMANQSDHPDRAAIVVKMLAEQKRAKVVELKAKFEQRKRIYGLE